MASPHTWRSQINYRENDFFMETAELFFKYILHYVGLCFPTKLASVFSSETQFNIIMIIKYKGKKKSP